MPVLRERSGRWSAAKAVALVAAMLPAGWIAYQALMGDLGPRPVTEAIHQSGDWALRLLLLTLAITPAQRVLHYPRIILARRTLGVGAAAYAVLHLLLYVLDQRFDLPKVASEIVLRIYLTIGAVTLAGLIALAATSTNAAISRLGSSRWHALHRLVYAIALLAAVHFFLQSKLNLYQPVLMAGFLVWLLAYRVLARVNGGVSPLALAGLAIASAVATALGEATIYMIASGVDSRRILLAHFDLELEVRPAWWVLAAGLLVAGTAVWRQQPARQRSSARRIASNALSGAAQVQSGS
ncbi:MAG: sulfoxide reductase heme-binding subunit YedZ [Hyphomicrobiales bacterium]|nr:sulfoxide reductase heme-binding subunit YedZ [Hyphomicrobiales bacterium]